MHARNCHPPPEPAEGEAREVALHGEKDVTPDVQPNKILNEVIDRSRGGGRGEREQDAVRTKPMRRLAMMPDQHTRSA